MYVISAADFVSLRVVRRRVVGVKARVLQLEVARVHLEHAAGPQSGELADSGASDGRPTAVCALCECQPTCEVVPVILLCRSGSFEYTSGHIHKRGACAPFRPDGRARSAVRCGAAGPRLSRPAPARAAAAGPSVSAYRCSRDSPQGSQLQAAGAPAPARPAGGTASAGSRAS